MRTTLAFGIALLITGAAFAGPSPEAGVAGGLKAVETPPPMQIAQAKTGPSAPASTQRVNVPRSTGTGLSGVPLGVVGGTVLGMTPGVAALVGLVVVGGVVAIVANNNDDDCTPSGTGTGTGAGGC